MLKKKYIVYMIVAVAALSVAIALWMLGKGRIAPGALMLADDFDRPDSRELGSEWTRNNEGGMIKDNALVVKDGCIVSTRQTVGQNMRVEFDLVFTRRGGQMIYAGLMAEGWAEGCLMINAGPSGSIGVFRRTGNDFFYGREDRYLKHGKVSRVAYENDGYRSRVEVDGESVVDCLDTHLLAGKEKRVFFQAVNGEMRVDNVKISTLGERKSSELLRQAETLLREKEYGRAEKLYRRAARRTSGVEKEICRLGVGDCLVARKEYDEANEWYKRMTGDDISATIRRRLLVKKYELALRRNDWEEARESLESIFTDPEAGVEQGIVEQLLDYRPFLWQHRDSWAGKNLDEHIEILLEHVERLENYSLGNIMRLWWVARGEEGLERLSNRIVKQLDKGEPPWEVIMRDMTDCLAWRGQGVKARKLWRQVLSETTLRKEHYYSCGFNYPNFEVRDMVRREGAGLATSLWDGRIDMTKNNGPNALLEIIVNVWGDGEREIAERMIVEATGRMSASSAPILGIFQVLIHLADGEREAALPLLESLVSWGLYGRDGELSVVLLACLKGEEARELEDEDLWDGYYLFAGATGLLIPAAHQAKGDYAACKEALQKIQGLFYPWEAPHKIAERWLKRLKADHPEVF